MTLIDICVSTLQDPRVMDSLNSEDEKVGEKIEKESIDPRIVVTSMSDCSLTIQQTILRYLRRQPHLIPAFRENLIAAIRQKNWKFFLTLVELSHPTTIEKRNGMNAPYSNMAIRRAILKSFDATGTVVCDDQLDYLVDFVDSLNAAFSTITVEQCQNNVQMVLICNHFDDASCAYMEYRIRHQELRERRQEIPEDYRKLVIEASSYHPSVMEFAVYLRTYSRWIESEGRREMWPETVQRYMNMILKVTGPLDSPRGLTSEEYNMIHQAILNFEVLPSMRALQFAGEAADRNNMVIYNCCFNPPECLEDFKDIFHISMCGTGVAFSVENWVIRGLPQIAPWPENPSISTFVVPDTREGWCDALDFGIHEWYEGRDVQFDYSLVRPAGAPLITTGGTASGPKPLQDLLDFVREKIRNAAGSSLTSLEVHDICCMIGRIVQVGGVRRAAMLSLSDLHDPLMRDAKSGDWWKEHDYRQMANNSAVYTKKPSFGELANEFYSMVGSYSGERGIFNRGNLRKTMNKRRQASIGDDIDRMGTNPCGEIILLPKGLCNLTKVVCTPFDTEESLYRKQRISAILGTIQSMMTKFIYVSDKFRINAEKERLLGCSLGGVMQCPYARDFRVLNRLRVIAEKTNIEYAARFGINPSNAVTCVKPDGNSSTVDGSTSGISPAHAHYYIRHVRFPRDDPIGLLLRDQGVPNGRLTTKFDANTIIFAFPCKAASGAIIRTELSALEHLDYWKLYKEYYTKGHHNPSVTINYHHNGPIDSNLDKIFRSNCRTIQEAIREVKILADVHSSDDIITYNFSTQDRDGFIVTHMQEFRSFEIDIVINSLNGMYDDEWKKICENTSGEVPEIIDWLYSNWNIVGGISFLPASENETVYEDSLMPLQTITEADYNAMVKLFPHKVDFSLMMLYDAKKHMIDPKSIPACSGGICERGSQ